MFSQAMQIGRLESAGLSHRDADTILKGLQAVQAKQVQEVAKKYLIDDFLTVATLDPQPLTGATSTRPDTTQLRH
jgi:zinc protease